MACLPVAALLLVLTQAAKAQTIVGIWQGTLSGAENPRLTLKIGRTDEGALRGVFYRVDQNTSGLPFSDVKLAASEVNLTAVLFDVTYDAKLSADGKSMSGIWTQGKQASPLTLVLTTPEASWVQPAPARAKPMAATADPTFEVATVKPSGPNSKAQGLRSKLRRFEANRYTVKELIKFAYDVRDRQVEGGPAWMSDQPFDLTGEPDAAGVPSIDQVRGMVKKLLAERFGLSVHMTQKMFPVYVLSLNGNTAPKLTRSDPLMNDNSHITTKPMPDGQTLAVFMDMKMPEFCGILMNFIPGRQIVDETGLPSPYDFALSLPTQSLEHGEDAADISPIFYHAVEAQLGLKLQNADRPLPVVIVTHLEQPSPN